MATPRPARLPIEDGDALRATTMNDVGLCSSCLHCRIITARRSQYYLCERSATDPAFPRYPRLPVRVCRGYEAQGDEPADSLTIPSR
jgi:hypothetical protein